MAREEEPLPVVPVFGRSKGRDLGPIGPFAREKDVLCVFRRSEDMGHVLDGLQLALEWRCYIVYCNERSRAFLV